MSAEGSCGSSRPPLPHTPAAKLLRTPRSQAVKLLRTSQFIRKFQERHGISYSELDMSKVRKEGSLGIFQPGAASRAEARR